jgi:hypothetical protein
MFDPNDFAGGSGKFLNAKWLKTIPKMACKVRITGGGSRMVPEYEDKTKLKREAFLTVESSTDLFDGVKEMPLNKTNMDILLSGLGGQPNSWVTKEIGVFFDPTVKVGPEVKGGLRVKVFEADPFAPTPPPVAAAAPVEDSIPF